MFGTWKYDPETDEVHNLRSAFDPITARSNQHQACDRCHEKKLRCSGEKDGCERCVSNGLSCEYTRTGSKTSRRGKRVSQRVSDGGRGSSSTPASASPSTQDFPLPERSRGSRSRNTRRGGPKGSSTSQAAGEAILGHLNFPSLSPESTFDLSLFPGGSSIPPRTVVSASPAAYTASHNDPASLLGFTGLDSQAYPPWPTTTGYDPSLPTTSSFVSPYPTTAGPEIRPFMPPDFTHANSYPGFEPMGEYPDTTDYAALDPRFWPPSTQPGP